jgi:PAS domain S-box-containing protein
MTDVLQTAGFVVQCVASGFEAIQHLLEPQPYILVLNLQIQDIDGWELCHRIRQDPRIAGSPILQICSSTQCCARGLESGSNDCLTEPVDPEELLARVRVLAQTWMAEQALQTSNKRVELIADISRQLLEAQEPERIVSDLLERLSTHLGLEVCLHFMRDPGTGRLRLATFRGVTEDVRREIGFLDVGQGVCGKVATTGQPAVLNDFPKEAETAEVLRLMGISAFSCYPLAVRQQVIGTLGLGTRTGRKLGQQDLDLIETAASQVAVALERARLLDQLQESETRHRLALDAGRMGTWEWNTTGRAVWSQQTEVMFGIPAGSFEGTFEAFLSRVYPEDRDQVVRKIDRALVESPQYELEYRIVRADGSIRWQAAQGQVLFNAEGDLRGATGVCWDITDRKETEEAVRRSERRKREILDRILAFVGVLTPEGIVLEANRAALEFAALRAEDAIGKRLEDTYWFCYSPESQKEIRSLVASASAGTRARAELRARVSADRFLIIDFSILPLVEEGRIAYLIPSAIDITERRRAEQELLQARTMETVGTLASGVAHRFNNLLTTVIGNLGLALGDLPRSSQNRSLLESAMQGSQDAAQLTRRLLAYAGKGGFLRRRIDLSDSVLHTIEATRPSLPKRIELRVETAPSPVMVIMDPSQAQAVVEDLIKNAIEAIPDKGEVTVRTALVGSWVILEVADTGLGMDEDTKARIFDPFFTTRGLGRGLGLAAVKGIVSANSGTIKVETAPGRGSRFTVLLPAAGAESPPSGGIDWVI